MNRDRQVVKDIENKQAQAQEQYALNKALLNEYKVKEKTEDPGFKNNKQKKDK